MAPYRADTSRDDWESYLNPFINDGWKACSSAERFTNELPSMCVTGHAVGGSGKNSESEELSEEYTDTINLIEATREEGESRDTRLTFRALPCAKIQSTFVYISSESRQFIFRCPYESESSFSVKKLSSR